MESAATPRLAWKWILEKLVDLPNFGVTFLNEVITRHVTDIEDPHCRPLLERVALRNLEEMVVTNQIDYDAIPLLKALTGQGLCLGTSIGSSVKQRFNKELVLRVQTEVVISVLRKDVDEGEIDWALYEAELERVFGDAEEDNRLLDRKRELCALLKPKNQTNAVVASYFEKYALKKLRDDLYSFIEEKRESFKIMFLNQLSRDFRDANGKPFAEDVEKTTNVEAHGKQDHVGQTPNVNGTEDQHIVLETASSGKKRLRRKLLPTQDDIRDDESDEAEEGSAGMKRPRNVSLTSIVKPLLQQGVLELANPASGRRRGSFSMKQNVEACKQLSLLNGGEEPSSGLGNLVMRNCSPVAHESISLEVAKVSPREPSRTKKYVVISDVDSDAETQVVKTLSTDDEDSVTVEGDGDKHNKKGVQSLPENGSGRGHSQTIEEAEVVREETSIVLIEQKTLVDRKEASKGSPEVKVSQHEGHEKSVTKKDFILLDSQDTYEIDFLDVGSDGHEDACHVCGKNGKLVCCDGCPISIHFNCIKGLGIRLSSPKEDWYCPVCLSQRAAQEAAEAEKAAEAAKEKLKAFKMKSKKRDHFTEGDNSSPEKAGKQSRPRNGSLEFGECDRTLKPKQQSDNVPKQGQRDSDPPIENLVLKKALHHPRQKNSDRSLPAEKPQSNRLVTFGKDVDGNNVGRTLPVNEQLTLTSPNSLVKNGAGSIRDVSAKSQKTQLSHNQEVSRRDWFAASTSEQVKKERERFSRFKKKKGTGVDSDEESGEQSEPGVPEPASGAGSRREMEGDEDDEDDEELDEDCSEDRIQGAFCSGRQRIPGLRRKPLPWTRQEELALKEGVKRFSHNGSWGFQWKRILEFGQGRFDPTRTDVDLKDKWRNLVKGVS